MATSPKPAKCVQCNAPVLESNLLCQSCQAPSSPNAAVISGDASTPNVSQPSHVSAPPLPAVTDPNKKRDLLLKTVVGVGFTLLCVFALGHYGVGLKDQNDIAKEEWAASHKRGPQQTGVPRSVSGRMLAGTFVYVEAFAASTDILDFRPDGSYVHATQSAHNTQQYPGAYRIKDQQITLQEVTGNTFTGSVTPDFITIRWRQRIIQYARIRPESGGHRTATPPPVYPPQPSSMPATYSSPVILSDQQLREPLRDAAERDCWMIMNRTDSFLGAHFDDPKFQLRQSNIYIADCDRYLSNYGNFPDMCRDVRDRRNALQNAVDNL